MMKPQSTVTFHKPLSPLTGQTQTNVSCYTADTKNVTCYRTDTKQCHRLQGRHKPLSPVTGQTQTTLIGCRKETNHCHQLQSRHKPLSPVTGQTLTTVTFYRADTKQCHLLQGRHKAMLPVTGQTQTNDTGYRTDTRTNVIGNKADIQPTFSYLLINIGLNTIIPIQILCLWGIINSKFNMFHLELV